MRLIKFDKFNILKNLIVIKFDNDKTQDLRNYNIINVFFLISLDLKKH